jgi:hypothetical protein
MVPHCALLNRALRSSARPAVCCVEHRPNAAARYDRHMKFSQRKSLVLAAWVGMVVTVGMTIAIDNPLTWVVIGGLAVIPVVIGNHLWDLPETTLSELIVRARSQS